MLTSFSRIYNFIIKGTVITFGVIFTILCCLLVYFFFDNLLWYIPFLIISVVVSTLVGSYLYVVLNIPFQLPAKFDPIKNSVALGDYENLEAFQVEIASFMVSFFSFFGANVVGGKFHFKNCEAHIVACDVDFSAMSEDSFKKSVLRLKNNRKAFHLPIHLGDESLGYMILICEDYTLPILLSVFKDFENYYLDDQIKHFVS